MFDQVHHCKEEEELLALARQFSRWLREGDVCLLYGEMGAGKTFFTTEVYKSLGGDINEVSSPTFTLVNQYPLGDKEIYHIDLYRVQHVEAMDDISQESWMNPVKAISFIEWSERLSHWKPDRGYELHFAHENPGRSLKIKTI